jgi:pimeloyl-ACP methyl ester carboxylesterase
MEYRMNYPARQLTLATLIFGALLAGCGGGSTSGGSPPSTTSSPVVLFDPVAASAVIPFPNDFLFNGTTDSTLNIIPVSAPFVEQANLLDGFSTVESAFLDILGDVDLVTVAAGIRIFKAPAGPLLTQGVDYTITRSPVILSRTRLLIKPLRPLSPRTQYIVFATDDLMTPAGIPLVESVMFAAVKSTDPVGSVGNPTPATTPPLDPTQVGKLEAIRQAMAPIFNNVAPAVGLTRPDIVLAWSFTTQSIGTTLGLLNSAAVARPIGAAAAPGPGGTLSTGELGLGLADTADIYVGTFTLPYYLTPPSGPDPTAPLTKFWETDPAVAAAAISSSVPGNPPCGAFARSVSTTACFPTPLEKAMLTIPMIVTVPNGNAPPKPLTGWPVVIFQHGITRNRSDMLALAPTLASAGFVTVAIDLPLHGIRAIDGATAGFRIPGVTERTFEVDYVSNTTGAAGSDGIVDASGTHFINLSSLITSRDNLRQSTIDIINLAKSVGDLDANPSIGDIDETKINFVGHSLGGIVGTTALGVNSTDINAATLAMPGGGIGKLLDGSATFGPRISGGLFAANSALLEGTDSYESYLRFAQTIADSGDPINYAADAAAAHPIHMIEVVGEAGVSLPDQVVPNFVARTAAAPAACPSYAGAGVPPGAKGPVCVAGLLSGTEPLYQVMGLNVAGPVEPGVTPVSPQIADTVVRFTRGDHSSFLDPTTSGSLVATCEMQRETAQFLASNGLGFTAGGACPLP